MQLHVLYPVLQAFSASGYCLDVPVKTVWYLPPGRKLPDARSLACALRGVLLLSVQTT